MNNEIKKVVLELEPDTYNVVRDAVIWYHESLHMITDPAKYDPELPLEQLDVVEMKRRIIKMHRLMQQFKEISTC